MITPIYTNIKQKGNIYVLNEKQDEYNQQTALKDFSNVFHLILTKDTKTTLCNLKTNLDVSVRFLHQNLGFFHFHVFF
jgi:hypothetical protein